LLFVVALALGSLARTDALDAGFWSDDYLHHAMLHGGYPLPRHAFDLFRFAGGGEHETKALTGFGYYPWWTHTDFRLSMLRPLASLSHAFDDAVLGPDARAHHLHSFVWWMLCVGAVSALLFEGLPPLAAGIAAALFALDESHSVPMLWIANRSLLMATAFGAAALFFHMRYRRSGARGARVGSIALFALALACGEYALPLLGYLCCLELVDPVPGASRARALAPFLALGIAFVSLCALFGYGAAHSGLYTSPLDSPIAYGRKLSQGLPVLVGELVLGVPADHFTFGPPWAVRLVELGLLDPGSPKLLSNVRSVQIGLGIFGGVVALVLWLRVRSRLHPEHARSLDWLVAGIPIALLPVLGSFITTRLALPASIGVAALFGTALMAALGALRDAREHGFSARAFGALVLAGLVLFVHGYRAAAQGHATTALYGQVARARTRVPLDAEIDDSQIAKQRVIMVAAADANDAPYLPFVRYAHGRPLPKGFRLLSGSPGAHELRRIDATTIDLTVMSGTGLGGSVVGSLTRGRADALAVGQHFDLPGLRVEVRSTSGRQPLRMRYTFDTPLEDPSLLWLEATPQGLRKLVLPAPGTTRIVAAPVLPDLVANAGEL
jgi:hypothetical protein